MILSLKNIGKLVETQIAIDGITVIAGENDTGKSTVGKALFAVFNSFYKLDEQIRSDRIRTVARLIDLQFVKTKTVRFLSGVDAKEAVKDIVVHRNKYCEDLTMLKGGVISSLMQLGVSLEEDMDGYDIDETVKRVHEILMISDEEILKSILDKKMVSEFNGQITNLASDQKGEMILQIKNEHIAISIEKNRVVGIENSIKLKTEAVYMDDPFLLDGCSWPDFFFEPGYAEHRSHLRDKLFHDKRNQTVAEKIIVNKKFNSIYKKISSICGGEIIKKNREGYGYKSADFDKPLDIRNLSTGLKTFVILKMLLMNGGIEYNGVVILDEPEIHLHPEWQLRFAELIVLLHKEFSVHILLNTHSPYFLRAIQVYSAKYEMADKCRYYLSENIGAQAIIIDVSDDVERIYAKLSKPLQDLEDERWRDDSLA